ncbi:peptidase domain-containing ABC transporter [Pseudomonas sp. NC26]|uniref:Peptidase domain-containing ABC transporter n=4 Tax=Pseudomonas TaxID=286 RepID=A0A7W2QJN6_PSEPU|nr:MULTISPECIES: peptidase domain-containing ABC transporter [Pseudomonas]MBA6117088.1 peptidase domain-containing ABC transporter [Pseudomonas putida]MCZ9638503.1 peptidase domain-containing ABC transporter [Pseudomonas putida]MEC4878692.1 peptidase domain-containing ABC transporter [Pseudomonas sp. NC26]QNL86722.1 N-terminal double-glycine peptidase domain-containing bacteriocin/lantibiotic efflux ABC transporter permease/ATP-binding protein [Pseudomonas putida]
MTLSQSLSFGIGRKLPVMLQVEAAECGQACLAMIAAYHGQVHDMHSLRQKLSPSMKGVTLKQLIAMAGQLGLATRPLRLELEALEQLRLPCILHWEFNHFVVLKEVGPRGVVLHDPARGVRKLSLDEVSAAFTGIALELWPQSDFQPGEAKSQVSLRRLLGRVQGFGGVLGHVLALGLALELCMILTPFFLQTVIDKVLVSADLDLLAVLALGFGLLLVAQQVLSLGRSWALMYLGTLLGSQWQINVFNHLVRLPVAYFERRHLGDIISRFGSLKAIQRTLTTSFIEALLDGLMTVVTLALMFIYSPPLAMIAVLAMLLYALARWAWFGPLRRASEDELVRAAKQQSYFLETMRGVRTLKLFAHQEQRATAWSGLLVDEINAGLQPQKLQLLYRAFNGLLFGSVTLLVIWLGAKQVIDGVFSAGMLIAFNAYKDQFNSRVAGLIDKLVDVIMLRLHGERLADIVLETPEPRPAAILAPAPDRVPRLEVRHLKFRYSDHEPWVLDGVSLVIEPGESVAIVGPSGCGKTTLLNVMLGILPPVEGQVLLDNEPIDASTVDRLRQISATVLQDDVLFAGSIGENISFFASEPDQGWIEQCARLAAVHDDIARMPMGYNTLVGDMGTVLSGGQKQRILLARALYRRPRLLFLDEATSHLDIQREAAVNQALQTLNITRVIVAHRPDTIRTAQRVLVLVDGRIASDRREPGIAP